MTKALDNLSVWFEKKGFLWEEVPYFIEDVIRLIDQEKHTSLHLLNQEMESLGWGIQIMDETIYKLMLFLNRNKNSVS